MNKSVKHKDRWMRVMEKKKQMSIDFELLKRKRLDKFVKMEKSLSVKDRSFVNEL